MRRIARFLPLLLAIAFSAAPMTAVANDKNKPQPPGQSKQEEQKSQNLSNNGNNGVVKPTEPTPQPSQASDKGQQMQESPGQASQSGQSNAQSSGQPESKQPEPAQTKQPEPAQTKLPEPASTATTAANTAKSPQATTTPKVSTSTTTSAAKAPTKTATTRTATQASAAFDVDLACGSKTVGDANDRSVKAAEDRALRAAQAKTSKKPVSVSSEVAQNYIVRLKRGTNVGSEAAAAEGLGAVRAKFTSALPGFVVSLTPSRLCELEKRTAVETIEDDVAVSMMDTQTNATWGLDRIDQSALPLSGTYTYNTTAAGVRVYVVDTGIRADHSELVGRVQTGFTAISDGNGTVDCNGHGTHVSGTIAGTTWGVAKQAFVIPVRVLGCDGSGTSSGVIAGLDWIATNAVAPAIVNMSLGGGASSTLDSAVNNLVSRGFTVVVAAGNSAVDACTSSPARAAAAVTVAASDSSDRSASFTNFGTCVDMYGPGVGITSASISSTTATAVYSGTSMAAPHIAGAAALVLAASPGATPSVISAALLQAATIGAIVGAPSGTPNRLLHTTTTVVPVPQATVPFAPENLVGSTTRRTVTLSWTKPNDGGAPLTEYRIRMMQGTTTRVYVVSAASTTATIRNLKSGKIYSFMVSAVNSVGESAPSNSVTLIVA